MTLKMGFLGAPLPSYNMDYATFLGEAQILKVAIGPLRGSVAVSSNQKDFLNTEY